VFQAKKILDGEMELLEHELCLLEAVLPAHGQPLFPMVVLHESADLRFGELQVSFRLEVLLVQVDVLLEFQRGLDEVLKVLGYLRDDLVLRKDLRHRLTSRDLHIRHRVLVTQDHADLTRGFLCLCQFEDTALDLSRIQGAPLRVFLSHRMG
jgi:hypothetical protein